MQLTKLFLLAIVTCGAGANAAFTENSRRYLSPRDLFNVMAQKFPILRDQGKLKSGALDLNCWAIVNSNENVLGVVNPALGKPAVELPPPGFVRWLGSCGHKIIALEMQDLVANQKDERLWEKYFPAQILDKFRDSADKKTHYHALPSATWGELDPSLKAAMLKYSVGEMIGPEAVIHDLGYAKCTQDLTDALTKTVTDEMNIPDVLHNILLGLVLREEFLSY